MLAKTNDVCCALCTAQQPRLLITKAEYDVVECTECGLVFVANPPSPQRLAELYSFDSGYHQDLASEHDEFASHRAAARRHCDAIQATAAPGGRLLDVGCSVGFFLAEARDRGWDVHGLEYSPDTAGIARERFGLPVTTGTLQDAGLPAESFDVITLWDVIEHLPNPLETLIEARRLLRPGGVLAMETPNVDGLFPRASLLVAPLTGFWRHPEPPSHLFQFSARTMSEMLKKTGYEVVRVAHARIPIHYSFGTAREIFRSVKWAVYSLFFIPLALLGPIIGRGDTMTIIARKIDGEPSG